MRFKGIRFGMGDRDALRREFYGEYKRRVNIQKELGYTNEDDESEKIKIHAEIKLKLIREWEAKNRKMDFLDKQDTTAHLIYQRHYGRTWD